MWSGSRPQVQLRQGIAVASFLNFYVLDLTSVSHKQEMSSVLTVFLSSLQSGLIAFKLSYCFNIKGKSAFKHNQHISC